MHPPPPRFSLLLRISLVLLAVIGGSRASAQLKPPTIETQSFGSNMAMASAGNLRFLAARSTFGTSAKISVYRIQRNSTIAGTPVLEAEFTRSGANNGDDFGDAIAIRGAADGSVLLAIGAPRANDRRGLVSVKRRSAAGIWSSEGDLVHPTAGVDDWTGDEVAIAPSLQEIVVADGRRGLAIYTKSGATWNFDSVPHAPIASIIPTEPSTFGLVYVNSASAPSRIAHGIPLLFNGQSIQTGGVDLWSRAASGTWFLSGVLLPEFPTPVKRFGTTIATDGTRLLVGAPDSTVNSAVRAGRAFVYTLSPLALESELIPSVAFGHNLDFRDFGKALSLEGGAATIFASESFVPLGFNRPGITQFRRNTLGQWVEVSRQEPPGVYFQLSDDGFFARSFAATTDLFAMGDLSYPIDGVPSVGTIGILEMAPTKVSSQNPRPGGHFATSVSFGVDTVVVGEPRGTPPSSSLNGSSNSGAVELFLRSNGLWIRIGRFGDPAEGAEHDFGRSVAMRSDGLEALIGSPKSQGLTGGVNDPQQGLATAITKFNGVWQLTGSGIRGTQDGEQLGTSVATVKTTDGLSCRAAGAPLFDVTSGGATIIDAGRVLVQIGGTAPQTLLMPTPKSNCGFGSAMAMEAYPNGVVDLWVGAPEHELDDSRGTGTIFLFRRTAPSNEFLFVSAVRTPQGFVSGSFGSSIAMRSNTLVVGAPTTINPPFGEPGSVGLAGAAYVWIRSTTGSWLLRPVRHVGTQFLQRVGDGVATNGSQVIIGEPGFINSLGVRHGRVGVFQSSFFKSPSGAAPTFFVPTDPDHDMRYGDAVAIGTGANPAIFVGANQDSVAQFHMATCGSSYGFAGPENGCAADLNADFIIDELDLALFLSGWGAKGPDAELADVNLDGVVNGRDLTFLLAYWGECP